MTRNAIYSIAAVALFLASSIAAAQTTAPADANDTPIVPALAPATSSEPPTTAPAPPDVVVPTPVPTPPDIVVPTPVPTPPDVVVPTPVPTPPDVVVPTSAPAATPSTGPTSGPSTVVVPSTVPAKPPSGAEAEPPKGKYAGSLKWLNMAELEIRSIETDPNRAGQQNDYLLGALMNGYIEVEDLKSARRVFEEISAKSRLYWIGRLIARMLVNHDGEDEAFRLLAAIPEGEIRQLILRQLAGEMIRLDSLDGLALVARLQEADRSLVLGEWAMALVLAGKLVDARVAAEGATVEATKDAILTFGFAGQVAHGKKTFDQARAESGKPDEKFMRFLMALSWERLDNLDPNVAETLIEIMPVGPSRAGVAIGMAKNFIARRLPRAADKFADAMVADLKRTPVDKIPRPVYLDIAIVMAGVGRFDKAKIMFEQAVADRSQGQVVDRLLSFFEVLIEADGGDMADRLSARLPGLLRQQIIGLWGKFYIKHGQADRVRALLAKLRSPGQRATLYIGGAAGLRDLTDKPEAPKP